MLHVEICLVIYYTTHYRSITSLVRVLCKRIENDDIIQKMGSFLSLTFPHECTMLLLSKGSLFSCQKHYRTTRSWIFRHNISNHHRQKYWPEYCSRRTSKKSSYRGPAAGENLSVNGIHLTINCFTKKHTRTDFKNIQDEVCSHPFCLLPFGLAFLRCRQWCSSWQHSSR